MDAPKTQALKICLLWSGHDDFGQSNGIVYPYKLLPVSRSHETAWPGQLAGFPGNFGTSTVRWSSICHRKQVFFFLPLLLDGVYNLWFIKFITSGNQTWFAETSQVYFDDFPSYKPPFIGPMIFPIVYGESSWIFHMNPTKRWVRCLRHQSKALSSGTKAVPMQKSRPHRGPNLGWLAHRGPNHFTVVLWMVISTPKIFTHTHIYI